jgi:hypothetical protein
MAVLYQLSYVGATPVILPPTTRSRGTLRCAKLGNNTHKMNLGNQPKRSPSNPGRPNGVRGRNVAWTYRHPYPWIREIRGRIAFWNGVEVVPD